MAAPLIAVVGPTAAGKSDLGLALARAHGGEIVSCDSLQVYRGLDIGSAKATAEERALVPHHLLDVAEPGDVFSAADYAGMARRAAREIAARGRPVLVVGGTGLYLRALLHGLFAGPGRDEALRRRLEALLDRFGEARLHRVLRRADPAAAARLDPKDRVRVVRALEVYFLTGRPLSQHHQSAPEPLTGFRVAVFVLDPGPEALRPRVEARTTRMFQEGLVDEVRGLLARGVSPLARPLSAIGYRQALGVAQGRLCLEDAIRETVTATMQYGKRQRTWFRHQSGGRWFSDPLPLSSEATAFLSS